MKRNQFQRTLATILALILVLSSIGVPVFAAEGDVIASGWSGYTTWKLTEDGTLTFSPSGQTEGGQCNLRNYWKVNGVLTLPWGAYADRITAVVIEEGIHDIGEMAFYGLTNLKSVTLPSTIVEIRDCAFKGCTALEEINFPEGLEKIGPSAFYGCTSLGKVDLPASVTELGEYAFAHCTGLTDLTLRNLETIIGEAAFKNVPDTDLYPEADFGAVLNEYGLAEDVDDGLILHAWCWNFNTIKEMIPQIAAAGFSGVQTSPINTVIEGDNGGLQIYGSGKWYYHYQPTEYEVIGNYQLGTAEEFIEMCEVAHQYGVKVIVDQVLNHMTASESAISDSIKNADWGEPGEWGNPDKPWTHKSTGTNWSERDRFEETQNSLSGLIEWNTQNENVQQYLLKWLKICVEAGADGFRYDAAKLIELPDDVSIYHPENNFASDFWPTVLQNGASFQYGEALQEGEPNHIYNSSLTGGYDDQDSSRLGAYQSQTFTTGSGEVKNMHTTLSFYGFRLRDAISSGNVNAEFVGDMLVPEGASAANTVTWVESHDNYCNNASYAELDEQQVIQAWAILASRKEGTPLFFSRPDGSSASNPWGNNVIGPEGSHFFMDSQVVAVNFFHNEMAGTEEYLSNPTGSDKVVMIERGTAGAVIVNLLEEDLVLEGAPVQSMADGSYTDQAYGSAFEVKGGKLYGTVKAGKVAVVYNSKVESPLEFEPEITLSVPTGDFLTDSLDVSVSIRGVERATYKVDDGEELAVSNGDIITVGEGLAADESVTLTVLGYNAAGEKIAEVSATYTRKAYRGDTIVYVEDALLAKRSWSQIYIYIWGSVDGATVQNAGWPGVRAELQTSGDWAGYWKYVLPFELENYENLHVIVHSNSGSQIERDDMVINPGETRVLTADESWISGDNVTVTSSVYMAPGDGTTFTDTIDVTLYALNCASATYAVNGGEAVAYNSGDVITLGAELGNNETVTVAVTGYDADGNVVAEATATYTKKMYKGNATIYVDPAIKPEWEEMAVYIYGAPGDNGGWPGHTFTEEDMENGLYVYQLPENFQGTTATVIFNNNNNGVQVERGWQIGPDEQKIWRADEAEADGVWEDYVIETNIYVSADFVAAQNWEAVSAHVYNLNNVSTSWPGIAGVLQEEGQWAGYYRMNLPNDPFEELDDLRVILNNAGAGSQMDVGDGGDVDMAWGQTKVMTASGMWMDGYLLSASNVYTLPEDGTGFYAESLDVTLFADNVVSATYQIGADGEKTAYVTGDVINVGAELADQESVTVYLEGVNAAGKTVTASSTYTKYYHADVEPVRVLFIGNSYTFYNDGVWTHFQKLAYTAGYNAAVDQVTIGSHRLYQFADPNESDPAGGPVVEQKLTDNVYDYVFLQEQSTAPVDQYAQFESGVVTLSNRIEQHNADAQVILYQTWGRETGSSDLTGRGWTNETMTYDLAYAYDKAAELVGATVSPAGTAFHEVYSKHASTIDLYDADQTHPTLEGTYLASLVHIGTVFGAEAVETAVGYTAGIKDSTIEVLKQAALAAPALVEQPHLYITPVADGKPMNGETITLTLNAVNVAEATYQLDGGEEIPFTYGAEITVEGETLADGSVTVTLKGVDAQGNAVGPFEATYTNSYHDYYLVLGWYAKTSTSGLDQTVVDEVVANMKAYLKTQGATDEQLANIAVRGYDGNVAAIGTAIRADGDVDVMIGVGENFDAPTTEGGPTAGVPIQEKTGGIYMGTSGKNRWMARLTDDEVAVLVYEWIKANYTTAP